MEEKEWENPAKSKYQKSRKQKKGIWRILGFLLVALQLLASCWFLKNIVNIGMLPMKYILIGGIALLGLWVIVFVTQKIHRGRAIFGKLLSILVIVILGAGSYYIGKVGNAFETVTGGSYKIDSMAVAVLKDDLAESIEDAKDYTFAVQYAIGEADIEEVVEAINTELGKEIDLVEYDSIKEQAEALHEGRVDAIIYNEGYTSLLEEAFEDQQNDIKIIYKYEIQKKLEFEESVEELEIEKNSFSVYISGIDVYGPISTNSRSDVNIIVTVNPDTHQILLTTTPRDYYVTIPGVSHGSKDKLTHAGIYGVDASMATLENLYKTDIPFYVRVNFTSVISIVNQLGGIDVYSEYSFANEDVVVRKGMNHFNGKQALAFARERYQLPGGDNQRGKNQQAVIVAIIKKMISPQMLTNASGLIESVSGNVQTNMSMAQIQELVKKQLNEGGAWKIYSVAATGTGSSNYTYSIPGMTSYVMIPDQSSVNHIQDLIERVENGEILEGSDIAQ